MELYSPWALLLLLLLPLTAYVMLRVRRGAAVRFPSLGDMRSCLISWRLKFRPVLAAARLVCLALLIIALARPREGSATGEISTQGVALEVVVDRSGSMAAEMNYGGQKLTRLDVVKKVLVDFVKGDNKELEGRSSDLIGLVTFARYADTKCPLVHSHDALLEFLDKTDIVQLREEDGTAIGDALSLGAARLKKAEEEIRMRRAAMGLSEDERDESGFKIKSKAIILLTDGINNTGRYNPMQAAELAKEWGIKVYTIGIGSGEAFTTVQTLMGSFMMPTGQELDERLLKQIADSTGGFYGRAGDADALKQIVKKIDDLERTEVKSVQYMQYSERFSGWTMGALLVLMGEMAAGCTIFRKIP